MPLPAGVTLAERTPERSRPPVPAGARAARVAPDTTRWCGGCDITLNAAGRQSFCTECRRTRNTDSQQARRERDRAAARPVGLTITSDALEELLIANSVLQRKMAVASGMNQPGNRQPAWLDELLLATKGLAIAVSEIECQLPQRHRR